MTDTIEAASNRQWAEQFIEADEYVTVLGYLEATARDTKQRFQSEWVHVLKVQHGK